MRKPLLVAAVCLLSLGAAQAATLMVANKSDNTVTFIDPKTGKVRATATTGHRPHEALISPDGRLAVVSDYGDRNLLGHTLTFYSMRSLDRAKVVDLGHHLRPHGLAWLPDRTIAVTAEGSGYLLVVNPVTGKITKAIKTGQQVSHMVVATPDGKRAFVSNIGSGSVTVIDLDKAEKIKDIKTGPGAEGMAITPDGKQLWVGNRAEDTLTIVDTQSLEILAKLDCKGFPIRLAITPDGKHALVSCARSGEVARFDVAARKEVARRKLDLSTVEDAAKRLFGTTFGDSPVPVGLLIAPNGKKAYVAATQADVVVVIDPATLEVIDLVKAGKEPDGMAITQN